MTNTKIFKVKITLTTVYSLYPEKTWSKLCSLLHTVSKRQCLYNTTTINHSSCHYTRFLPVRGTYDKFKVKRTFTNQQAMKLYMLLYIYGESHHSTQTLPPTPQMKNSLHILMNSNKKSVRKRKKIKKVNMIHWPMCIYLLME